MTIDVSSCTDSIWDDYVAVHPDATAWHMSAWRFVFEESYGHRAYYLIARNSLKATGVLPLFHLKSRLFGDSLVSLPFLDGGGALADNGETGKELLRRAVDLGRELRVKQLDLRWCCRPDWLDEAISSRHSLIVKEDRVRMVLPLPATPDDLLASFKSKLRSQIKRPLKEGCTAEIGGMELLDRFYGVFAENMRDLGSPVHAKRVFASVLSRLGDNARICVVSASGKGLAAAVLVWFRDTCCNPWASSLRQYGRLSPNMLLYWAMLQFACEKGLAFFDFGRSSPGEGSYRFKEQWGCTAHPLTWLTVPLGGSHNGRARTEKGAFGTLIKCWKRLPLPLATVAGPVIRKQISL